MKTAPRSYLVLVHIEKKNKSKNKQYLKRIPLNINPLNIPHTILNTIM